MSGLLLGVGAGVVLIGVGIFYESAWYVFAGLLCILVAVLVALGRMARSGEGQDRKDRKTRKTASVVGVLLGALISIWGGVYGLLSYVVHIAGEPGLGSPQAAMIYVALLIGTGVGSIAAGVLAQPKPVASVFIFSGSTVANLLAIWPGIEAWDTYHPEEFLPPLLGPAFVSAST